MCYLPSSCLVNIPFATLLLYPFITLLLYILLLFVSAMDFCRKISQPLHQLACDLAGAHLLEEQGIAGALLPSRRSDLVAARATTAIAQVALFIFGASIEPQSSLSVFSIVLPLHASLFSSADNANAVEDSTEEDGGDNVITRFARLVGANYSRTASILILVFFLYSHYHKKTPLPVKVLEVLIFYFRTIYQFSDLNDRGSRLFDAGGRDEGAANEGIHPFITKTHPYASQYMANHSTASPMDGAECGTAALSAASLLCCVAYFALGCALVLSRRARFMVSASLYAFVSSLGILLHLGRWKSWAPKEFPVDTTEIALLVISSLALQFVVALILSKRLLQARKM